MVGDKKKEKNTLLKGPPWADPTTQSQRGDMNLRQQVHHMWQQYRPEWRWTSGHDLLNAPPEREG